jgi:hypothetical protein
VKTLFAAISACALFAACSTMKVPPSVAERLARGEPRSKIENEITNADAAVDAASSRVLDAGAKLIRAKGTENAEALLATNDRSKIMAEARALADTTDPNAIVEAADFRVANDSLETELARREQLVRDRNMLQQVSSGEIENTVEKTWYFSIEPAVALKNGFNAVAIPSLGINCRPLGSGEALSAWAVQLLLGGALNPNDEGDQGTTGAVGLGLSHPIGSTGAFSFGAIGWDDDGEGRVSPYFSITLGDFAKPVPKD